MATHILADMKRLEELETKFEKMKTADVREGRIKIAAEIQELRASVEWAKMRYGCKCADCQKWHRYTALGEDPHNDTRLICRDCYDQRFGGGNCICSDTRCQGGCGIQACGECLDVCRCRDLLRD